MIMTSTAGRATLMARIVALHQLGKLKDAKTCTEIARDGSERELAALNTALTSLEQAPERYDQRVTSLTIDNLRVYQIGDVITLLQDAGYQVEINIDKPAG
jgi:hypothetical protein